MSKKQNVSNFYENFRFKLFSIIEILKKGIKNSTELKEMFENFLAYILKQLDLDLKNYKQLCDYVTKSPLSYDKLKFYYFICFMYDFCFSKFIIYNFFNDIKGFESRLKDINNIDNSKENMYLIDPIFYIKLYLNPKFYTRLYEHIINFREDYFVDNIFYGESIGKLKLLSIFDFEYSISYVRKYYRDKDMDRSIDIILDDLSKFDNLLSFSLYLYNCHIFFDMFDNIDNMREMFKNSSCKGDLFKAEVIYTLIDILFKVYSFNSRKDAFIKSLDDFSNICLTHYLASDCISDTVGMYRKVIFSNMFLMYLLSRVYLHYKTIDNNYSEKFFMICKNYLHNFSSYDELFYNPYSISMSSESNSNSVILDSFIQRVKQLDVNKNLDMILSDNIELCKSFYDNIILDVIIDYIGSNGKQIFEKDISNMQNFLIKIIEYKNISISVIEYLKSFNIKHVKSIVSKYLVSYKKYNMHLYKDVLYDFLSNIYVINLLNGQQCRNRKIKDEGILSHIICRQSKSIDELRSFTLKFIEDSSLEGGRNGILHSDEILYSVMINYLLFYILLPIYDKYDVNIILENIFDTLYMCMRESTYMQRKTFNRISNFYMDEYRVDYDLIRILYYIIYLIENDHVDVFIKKNKYSLFKKLFKDVINNCKFDIISTDVIKNIFVGNYKNMKRNLDLFNEFVNFV